MILEVGKVAFGWIVKGIKEWKIGKKKKRMLGVDWLERVEKCRQVVREDC